MAAGHLLVVRMQKKQPRTNSRHRPPFALGLTTVSSGHQSAHGTDSIDVSEAWMLERLPRSPWNFGADGPG